MLRETLLMDSLETVKMFYSDARTSGFSLASHFDWNGRRPPSPEPIFGQAAAREQHCNLWSLKGSRNCTNEFAGASSG